jgi:hypothetical protein
MKPQRGAVRPTPVSSTHSRNRMLIIGCVVAIAAIVLGYGMTRPSTPWAFDQPDAQKPFHR